MKQAVVRAYHNPDIAHKNVVKVRKDAPGSRPNEVPDVEGCYELF
jgi:hypothetical protein